MLARKEFCDGQCLKILDSQTTAWALLNTLLGGEEVAAFGLAGFTFCGIQLQCLE